MAATISANIIAKSKTKYIIDATRGGASLKSIDVLNESNSFPIKIQSKRYKLAELIISGLNIGDNFLSSIAFQLLINDINFFDYNIDINDLKNSINDNIFNIVAGVNTSDY